MSQISQSTPTFTYYETDGQVVGEVVPEANLSENCNLSIGQSMSDNHQLPPWLRNDWGEDSSLSFMWRGECGDDAWKLDVLYHISGRPALVACDRKDWFKLFKIGDQSFIWTREDLGISRFVGTYRTMSTFLKAYEDSQMRLPIVECEPVDVDAEVEYDYAQLFYSRLGGAEEENWTGIREPDPPGLVFP